MNRFIAFLFLLTLSCSGISPTFDWQGHRGARGLVPENTLPAFEKALDLEMNTLEMDVVISADEAVVVSHEPWMSAVICTAPDGTPVATTTQREHNLYQMTVAEIQQYDCGQRGHPRFPEQVPQAVAKPTLEEVVQMAEGFSRPAPIFYNIEIKSTPAGDGIFHPAPAQFAQLLYDVLEAEKVLGRTTVQSFDVRALQAMRTIDPAVHLVLLVGNHDGLAANLDALGFIPNTYSPNYQLVTPELVASAHQKGMKLIPWTVNEPADMQRLIEMGVDGLITDYPDRAQPFLHPR